MDGGAAKWMIKRIGSIHGHCYSQQVTTSDDDAF
jgi:hypothetical protein